MAGHMVGIGKLVGGLVEVWECWYIGVGSMKVKRWDDVS